jgi:hypothetical protein
VDPEKAPQTRLTVGCAMVAIEIVTRKTSAAEWDHGDGFQSA